MLPPWPIRLETTAVTGRLRTARGVLSFQLYGEVGQAGA